MHPKAKSSSSKSFRSMRVLIILFILTFFVVEVCWSAEGDDKRNIVHFNGNEIELVAQKVYPGNYIDVLRKRKRMFYFVSLPDSINVKNRLTGDVSKIPVPTETIPMAINGKPILGNERKYNIFNDCEEYTPPLYSGSGELGNYLFNSLRTTFNKLEDGVYHIGVNNIVVDENGAIAYYAQSGIAVDYSPWEKAPLINNDISKKIQEKLILLLNGDVRFAPAINKAGQPVNARLSFDKYLIEVKGHKATILDIGSGC